MMITIINLTIQWHKHMLSHTSFEILAIVREVSTGAIYENRFYYRGCVTSVGVWWLKPGHVSTSIIIISWYQWLFRPVWSAEIGPRSCHWSPFNQCHAADQFACSHSDSGLCSVQARLGYVQCACNTCCIIAQSIFVVIRHQRILETQSHSI